MKSKMKNKFLTMIVTLVAILGLMPLSTNGATEETVNRAPKLRFGQIGGEVVKQSDDFKTDGNSDDLNVRPNPNGYGTVKVTAKDPDGDGIAYIKYNWDYDLKETEPTILTYHEMIASRTEQIEVPQTNGLHILRICAIDQKGNQSEWIKMPYYIVDQKSENADITPPVLNQENPEELPRSNEVINAGRKFTIRFSDNESGIYDIAYAWTKTEAESPDLTEYNEVVQPLNGVITFNAPKEAKVGEKWTLRVFAANSTFDYTEEAFMTSNIIYFDYTIADLEAPEILLNGQEVVDIKEGETYTDEGATVTDNYDAKKVIYANQEGLNVIGENTYKFTTRGIYTLTYQTTDTAGHASATVTRTIKVTGENEIVKIIKPDKMNYNYGEDLDLTGACIEVTSKTGEVTNIPVEKEMFTNFDTNRLGAYEATFTYAGQEISYPYMVRDYVKDIVITLPRTEFDYKEELDLTGATVQKIWASNADTIAVPITKSMLGEDFVFESNTLGEKTITIYYAGIEKDIKVMVKDLSAPVITLTQGKDNENGVNEVSLEIGEKIDLNDYNATDNYDTENRIPVDVVITSNNVNTKKAGVYTVVYEAVDSHGRRAIKTRKVTVTIDKTELNELIESIDLEKDDYTDDSWKDLEDAKNLPDDTIEDLENKKHAIEDAIIGLVKKDLDTTEFNRLIEEIKKLVNTDYTTESWNNLKNKESKGYEAKETGLQSKLDVAVEDIKQAIKNLVANKVNQDAIKPIEEKLNKDYLESDYTEESWKAINDAIDAAKEITDLQSKFDKAVAKIDIEGTLVAKDIDTSALDVIEAEFNQLIKENKYTESSIEAIEAAIANARLQPLQSKFDDAVSKIDLTTLVLIPVISNPQITTSNVNKGFAKVDDVITITFESKVELNLESTIIKLNKTTAKASKVENEANKYQASFKMHNGYSEKELRYAITAVGATEDAVRTYSNEKSGIIFDKTAPEVNFAEGIGDNKTLEVKTEYEVSKNDIVVSDNYTEVADIKVEITTDLNVNVVNEADKTYVVTYTITDLAGNVTTKTRTIKVVDTTPPVITLNGENPVIIEVGQKYEEKGAKVTDNYDTDIQDKLNIDSTALKIYEAGKYEIIYTVTDSHGKTAEERREVIVLYKGYLQEAIKSTEGLKEIDYDSDAWKALQDALKMPENTQAEIDNKTKAINDAVKNLSNNKKALNTTEYDKLKDEIEDLKGNDYTPETWKSLNDKKTEIENAIESGDLLQSELNEKIKELQDLIDKLQAKPVDQSAIGILEQAIKTNKKESDYTPESWKELQDAIDDAKKITDLQSKFDEAVGKIKINDILKPAEFDKSALDKIKADLEKLNSNDYTEPSWNAVQAKIADAESKELKSEFDAVVKDINLINDLVLKPVVNKVTVTSSNTTNGKYANVNDIITLTIESNVELDLSKTVVKLNATPITITKVGDNYQGMFTMNENCLEGELTYSITAVETREGATSTKNGKTGIIFDKTSPTISLVTGIVDTKVKFGSEYAPSENDVVVTDANATKVEILTNYDSKVLGTYTVTYKATDAAGNASTTVTRNITVEDYITGIELIKPVDKTYDQGEKLDVTGGMIKLIMASGNPGNIINMETSMVHGFNSTNPGKQTLTVIYNGFSAEFEIIILDSTNPTIVLTGDNTVTIEVGGTYTELGATVEDNIDKTLIPTITGEVDTTKVGTYEIYYSAVDTAGNKAVTEKRTVHVVDTQKPVVTVVGDNPQIIEAGSEYVELGATARDNYDGDITSKIRINSSEVNTTKPGEYEVRYVVVDSSKNEADFVTRKVKVVDTTKPVITLKGAAEITIEVGSTYTDEGVTVTDNGDKDIQSKLVDTVNQVDTTKVRDYIITYNVMDANRNIADQVTRTVKVVDTTKPVIELKGDAKVTVKVGNTYTDEGVTVTDNYDEDIQTKLVTVNQVDTTTLGTYTITYNVTDANGNVAEQVTRTVEVVDKKAPEIELVGDKTYFEMIAGEDFTDPEFTITDNYDKNCEIVKEGNFNPNKEDTYVVTYYAKDHSGNKSKNGIEITIKVQAKPPVISFVTDGKETVLEEGAVFKKDTEITFDKGTAILTRKNGNEIKTDNDFKGGKLSDGEYTITATDPSGSKTTIHFVVDSTPPVVNLRTGFYENNVTIEFANPDDVHSAILISSEGFNEIRNKYDNGITITKQGTYSLFAFDEYGNYTRVDFEIK